MRNVKNRGLKIFLLIVIVGLIASCSEDSESTPTYFKLDGTNYAIDYTDCKPLGNDYKVITLRRAPESISDFSCELTFFGYTSTPAEGEYQVLGTSTSTAQGFVDIVIRGGNLGVTYFGLGGTVTVKKSNGKTFYTYNDVEFSAPGGITKTGSAELRCF